MIEGKREGTRDKYYFKVLCSSLICASREFLVYATMELIPLSKVLSHQIIH